MICADRAVMGGIGSKGGFFVFNRERYDAAVGIEERSEVAGDTHFRSGNDDCRLRLDSGLCSSDQIGVEGEGTEASDENAAE